MRPVCASVVVAVAAVAAAACVEKEPPGSQRRPVSRAYIEAHLLSAAPAMSHTVNADLGGKVVYLGNDVDKDRIAPGDAVVIKHYWKVTEPPGTVWRVFAHVVGKHDGDWLNVDDSDMRAAHGPPAWKAGEIIVDEQRITIPKTWKSPSARIVVGLYRKGAQGAAGRMMVIRGPHDDEHRVIARELPVVRGSSPPAAPYRIRRAASPIVIDGKDDDRDWALANRTAAFVDTDGGPALGQATSARMLWDDDNLYVFVEVADTDVFSPFTHRDGTLWKADTVELFIDADGNRRGYIELQVNPNNAQFDAWFARTRREGGDTTWSAGMRSAVGVRGTTSKRDDKDRGWDVELALPLAAVKGRDDTMAITLPPRPGDIWRLNIVRVDKPRGADSIRASSLSAITIQDFHALDRLATVVFADEANAPTPPQGTATKSGRRAAPRPRGATPALRSLAKPVPRPPAGASSAPH